MFDDNSLAKPGQVPGNLPTTEPDDMLAGADAMPGGSSALDAGILRPKTATPPVNNFPSQPQAPGNNFTGLPPELDSRTPDLSEPEPATGHRTLTLVLLVLVLLIVGGGGFWVYLNFMRTAPTTDTVTPVDTTPVQPVQEVPVQNPPVQDNPIVVTTTLDSTILDGQPLDTDADGLTDDQERTLKTNPMSWDTDGDQLSDGDEANTWQTDPLVADTDGDTYKDGDEIRNGYNPKGPGRLFQPGQGPATTSAATATGTANVAATSTRL